MNATWRTRTALGLAAVALGGLTWTTVAQAAPDPTPTPTPVATAVADATLARNLTFMREEERFARDLYQALAAQYDDAAPFVQIARSEQRHFDTLGLLLTRYGIPDPSAGRASGSYADPELQSLYDSLLAQGRQSLDSAYAVGVTVEEQDIADLKAAIAETKQADARQVFGNLMNGSQNHLARFTAAKNGTMVGAGNGQGMRQARRGDDPAYGARGGNAASGRGMGRGPDSTQRPADCPVR